MKVKTETWAAKPSAIEVEGFEECMWVPYIFDTKHVYAIRPKIGNDSVTFEGSIIEFVGGDSSIVKMEFEELSELYLKDDLFNFNDKN